MRNLFWTCTLALVCTPLASAQDFAALQAIINENIPATLQMVPELGRKPPTQESIDASKAVYEAAAKIYALPDLTAEDQQRVLQREAAALMVLAYADSQTYFPKLTLISDELEKRGLPKIVKETEKHVLGIGGTLVTNTGNGSTTIGNVEPLAERMIMYAEQFPGAESLQIIDIFLQRIRSMNNAAHRDRRLALAAPIFQKYYQKINHSARALALEPDIMRATLPGQPMFITGVDINGQDLDWQSLNDKVVLLQFWGTWCAHCKEEMPELIALYEKYHDAGLEIIGVNTGVKGDDAAKVKQFLDTQSFGGKRIPWTILHEGLGQSKNNTTMTKIYGIDELPVLILVGRNGKVLNLHPLPATLDNLIGDATSIFATVELTEEERQKRDEAIKKQHEAIDEQIKKDLSL